MKKPKVKRGVYYLSFIMSAYVFCVICRLQGNI